MYPFSAKHFIYTLSDPRTGVVKYVGCSRNPFARARQHFYSKSSPVGMWIAKLLSEGVTPALTVVAEARGLYAGWRKEKALIDKLWSTSELLNRRPGRKPSNKFTQELSER
jgi:hypothetical protein